MKEKTYEGTKKTQNGLKRMFFSVLAILLQAVFMVYMFTRLNEYAAAINTTTSVLAIILVLGLYNREQTASMTTPWIILILAFPIMGVSLYLLVGLNGAPNKMRARFEEVDSMLLPCLPENADILSDMYEKVPQAAGISTYLAKNALYPVYQNTDVTYYDQASKGLEAQLSDLSKAKKFIFMEYFIVAKGYVWDRVLEVLKRKAAEGVEVRFMYDGTCTVSLLPPNYPKKLEQEGIACRVFSPIRPALSTHQNNRDHRKIVVIDGKVAFTGGINLADEYVNRKIRFGHWKDTAIMLEGDAVRSFTLMFLEMWNVAKSEKVEEFDPYLDVIYEREKHSGEGFVIPYGDSPIDGEHVGKMVYMDILNTSKRYVHIMTPYLILDNEMMTALKFAAKRGVEVIIIMPHVPDKWYAFVLAKTYYNELLDAGVQIYEYTPGFVHAKVFTSDDRKAVVGTINMDYRSLYLHFECAAFLYENSEIPAVENDFQETLKKCQKITQEDYKKQKSFDKIAGRILRVFAPLM